MPRAVYFDCFSGASGDMLLGALIDAGVDVEALRSGLATLPLRGWSLQAEAVQSRGLRGTRAKVTVADVDQPHRGFREISHILQNGSLPDAVADRACRVFHQLAEVEAFI